MNHIVVRYARKKSTNYFVATVLNKDSEDNTLEVKYMVETPRNLPTDLCFLKRMISIQCPFRMLL